MIPPESDAEFVACMEEVLETYENPYHAEQPVICMDEQPVQLIKETKQPIEATKDHPKRVDYEYERNGTASIFMFAEPLSGFRQTTARPHRTKVDWAQEVAHLLDTRYADCKQVTLVLDNLNTHTKGAQSIIDLGSNTQSLIDRALLLVIPRELNDVSTIDHSLRFSAKNVVEEVFTKLGGDLAVVDKVFAEAEDTWPFNRSNRVTIDICK